MFKSVLNPGILKFQFEPRIEEKNLGIVHHILIYKCSDPKQIPQEHGFVCKGGGESGCNALIYAWAIGQAVRQTYSPWARGGRRYLLREPHFNGTMLFKNINCNYFCLLDIPSLSQESYGFFGVNIEFFIQNNMGLETKILSLSILDAE